MTRSTIHNYTTSLTSTTLICLLLNAYPPQLHKTLHSPLTYSM